MPIIAPPILMQRVVLLLKKICAAFLSALLLSGLALPAAADEPDTSAAAAILMHADSGQVLYAHNADARMLIASTTKIMTAIVVLESCSLDEAVLVGAESVGVEGSSMYLEAGRTYTVEQLLYGMMLASGNDAATALAIHTAGSIEAFAQMMNDKAQELRLTGSSFKNPHGLDEDGHYSTAEDLACLTAYCMENPDFQKIVSTKSYTVGELTYVNHNKLLSMYTGTLGVKTGYTSSAGRSLVSCAERDGIRLICVTLGDPDDWDDHCNLYDWAFGNYSLNCAVSGQESFSLPLVSGQADSVTVRPERDLNVFCRKGLLPEITVELPRFAFAPVSRGEQAGSIVVTTPSGVAERCALVFAEDVDRDDELKLTPYERFLRVWTLAGKHLGHPYYLIGDKE